MKSLLRNICIYILLLLLSILILFGLNKFVYASPPAVKSYSADASIENKGEYYWNDMISHSSYMCGQHPSYLSHQVTATVKIIYNPGTLKFKPTLRNNQTLTNSATFIWDVTDDHKLVLDAPDDPKLESVAYYGMNRSPDTLSHGPAKTIYTGNKSEYIASGSGSGTNNALGYLLAEGASDAGCPPAGSYVNVAFWTWQANGNPRGLLKFKSASTSDYMESIQEEFEEWIMDEDHEDDFNGEEFDTTETKAAAANLWGEAVIFQKMWNTIHANGGYENTITDKTKKENVDVVYNAEDKEYIIGPFAVEYLEVWCNTMQFAGMTGSPELKARVNGREEVLKWNKDWSFILISSHDNVYPRNDMPFYIKLKYKEGMEKLLGMKFHFRVLSSTGSYQLYEGHITTYKWTVNQTVDQCAECYLCDGGAANNGGDIVDEQKKHDSSKTHYHGTGRSHYLGRSHSGCNNYTAHWECDHDCDNEECTHDCSDTTLGCGGYYTCDGHKCRAGSHIDGHDNGSSEIWFENKGDEHIKKITVKVTRSDADIELDCQDIAWNAGARRFYISKEKSFEWNIDLTTSLAGNVWVDFDPQKNSNAINGIKDSDVPEENGLKNVAVTVYLYNSNGQKVKPAIAHNANGALISWPLYTDGNGYYEVNRLEAPGSGSKYFYVVEFEYDGQVYTNTIYLGDKGNVLEGNAAQRTAEEYKANSSHYFDSSMVVEEVADRYAFDKTFGEITGDSQIQSDYSTTGITNTTDISGNNGSYNGDSKFNTISYYGEVKSDDENGGSNVVSKLDSAAQNPSNQNQRVSSGGKYERYRMVASTYYNDTDTYGVSVNKENFRIQYPLGGWKYIMNKKESGNKRYVDEYMLHINCGLMGRAFTDVSVLKDIYKMSVVVNEQEMVQEFNILGKQSGDSSEYNTLKIHLENNRVTGYKLGLYESDVSYNSFDRYSKAIEQINKIKEDTELRVFVTYAVRVYNNSETNDVRINEITDYYDEVYTLVNDTNAEMLGMVEDGIEASIVREDLKREKKIVADKPYYRILSSNDPYSKCSWKPTKEENLAGFASDKCGEFTWDIVNASQEGEYKTFCSNPKVGQMNKATSSTLKDVKLKVNEYAEIFTTYEIDYKGFVDMTKSEASDINLRQILYQDKEKNNIAEVSNYSTLYSEKDTEGGNYRPYATNWVSGRVDQDSAPNNIKTSSKKDIEDIKFYEDDTCSAIPLKISLETYERDMYGYVFEDKKNLESNYDLTNGEKLKTGNGIFDGEDILVNDVKVSMYEVINLAEVGDGTGDIKYNDLEYYYEIPSEFYNNGNGSVLTSNTKVNDIDGNQVQGNYYLYGFLAGDYVLRFDYGTKSDSKGTIYSTDENGNIITSEGNDIIKYNGQDYENTAFLSETTYGSYSAINDKFLNLSKETINGIQAVIELDGAKAYSVARDNESRRMVVDAYSRTIENDRGEILRDRLASNDEFVKATKMFAETPIMQIEIVEPKQINKNPDTNKLLRITKSTSEVSATNIEEHKYHIKNINFGLEERAKTDIDLEKYIEKIRINKNNECIFSAKLDEDGKVIVSDKDTSNLDKMTYMTHVAANDASQGLYQQGFYAVAVEDDYLNGLTMSIWYKIKIINNSEVDFTGRLANYYVANEIIEKATYAPTTEANQDYIGELLIDDEEHGISTNSTLAEILKLHGEDATLSELISTHRDSISTESESKNISINDSIRPDVIVYGKYVGRFYYENKIDEDSQNYVIINYRNEAMPDVNINYDGDNVVKTTVDQLIDYVDINASYDLSTQNYDNYMWDLSGNLERTGERETIPFLKGIVSKYAYRAVKGAFNIYDEKDNGLVTEVSSNIVISKNNKLEKLGKLAENHENSAFDTYLEKDYSDTGRVEYTDEYRNINSLDNNNLQRELVPKNYNEDNSITNMWVVIAKTTSSETDSNNMKFDNLAEVLVYSNTTGRRDVTSVPGNAMVLATKEGFWKAGYNSIEYWKTKGYDESSLGMQWVEYPEDDAYSPEFVTIIAPTGIAMRRYVKNVILPISLLVVIMIMIVGVFGYKQVKIMKRNKHF